MAESSKKSEHTEGATPLGHASDYMRVDSSDKSIDAASGHKKLTAEDIRRRSQQRKEQKARERAERSEKTKPVASMVRMGGTALAVLTALGCWIYVGTTADDYEQDLAVANNKINELDGKMNDAKSDADNLPDIDTLQAQLVAASDRANEVADLQNKIGKYQIDTASDESIKKYGELIDQSKTFFTRNAVSGNGFLPHGNWYSPQYKGKNKDGRLIWMPLPGDKWGWSAVPSKGVGADGSIPMLWEARLRGGKDDGLLLAWVRAEYFPGTNTFGKLSIGRTKDGWDRIGATSAEGETPEDEKVNGNNGPVNPADVLGDAQADDLSERHKGGEHKRNNRLKDNEPGGPPQAQRNENSDYDPSRQRREGIDDAQSAADEVRQQEEQE